MRVMFSRAQGMLQQGRGRVLETWLRALPASVRGESPWALYWLGRCRLGYDPVEARGHLERAFALFERNDNDPSGLFSAWASIIDSFVFEWGEFASVDRWIEVLDRLLARPLKPPTPEIEARVAYGMFTALMYRQPYRSDLPQWAERVRSIVVNASDGRTQMLLGNQLMHYYTSWAGNVTAARLLLEAVRRPANAADFGPLAHIAWCAMKADYYWHVDAHEECLRSVQEGMQTAHQTGARFASSRLEAHGVMSSVIAGDFAEADRQLKNGAAAISGGRLVYRAHYHFLVFLNAFYQKDTLHAAASAREAVALADRAGVPICQALYRLGLAHALFSRGEGREALSCLAQARRLTHRMRIATTEFSCLSSTTYFLLARGKRSRAPSLPAQDTGGSEATRIHQSGVLDHRVHDAAFCRRARTRHRGGVRPRIDSPAQALAAARSVALGSVALPGEDLHTRPLQRADRRQTAPIQREGAAQTPRAADGAGGAWRTRRERAAIDRSAVAGRGRRRGASSMRGGIASTAEAARLR